MAGTSLLALIDDMSVMTKGGPGRDCLRWHPRRCVCAGVVNLVPRLVPGRARRGRGNSRVLVAKLQLRNLFAAAMSAAEPARSFGG
jgi:hypothetical protein